MLTNAWSCDSPVCGRGGGGGGWRVCEWVCVCVLMCLRSNEDINYLHVFPERAGVCVWLVAHFADVWLVWCVHMHVLFPVAAVGEASVTAIKFTLKRLLTCRIKHTHRQTHTHTHTHTFNTNFFQVWFVPFQALISGDKYIYVDEPLASLGCF